LFVLLIAALSLDAEGQNPGIQLTVGASSAPSANRQGRANQSDTLREPVEVRVRPAALAELIDELGGRSVTLPKARVISVLNPRVLLIESASLLPAVNGNFDRVLVFVDAGALRVDAATIVGANIRVFGTARTLLGMQVSGEVPWPKELTRAVLQRFEIRAAVLATSVRTADGVDLIARQ
jgi:hypothetical protein